MQWDRRGPTQKRCRQLHNVGTSSDDNCTWACPGLGLVSFRRACECAPPLAVVRAPTLTTSGAISSNTPPQQAAFCFLSLSDRATRSPTLQLLVSSSVNTSTPVSEMSLQKKSHTTATRRIPQSLQGTRAAPVGYSRQLATHMTAGCASYMGCLLRLDLAQ